MDDDISGVKPALGPVPDGVEVYPRYGDRGAVYILVNLSKAPQKISLPSPMEMFWQAERNRR